MKPFLVKRHLQFLNPLVRLITDPEAYLTHHLLLPFSWSFPRLLRKVPDVAFLQLPLLCLQADLRCSSLQSISSAPNRRLKKNVIEKRCVELYVISHHLLSDQLLVCQAFARYSVFTVTGTSILRQLVRQIGK